MDYKIKFHVMTNRNFTSEDRVFLIGEKYPVYDKNGRSLLCAENGEFLFSNELMDRVIKSWELEVVK